VVAPLRRCPVDSSDAQGPALAAAVAARTAEIVGALSGLDDDRLDGPSRLEGWNRLTIACHLRYGAEALRQMTEDALAGRPTSFYPGGRQRQRPGTLTPAAGESPAGVVESLGERSRELDRAWASLVGSDWEVVVTESGGKPDLGPLPLVRLPLTRLTEVEAHGTDLGLGLSEWSENFVEVALPFRLDWLNVRRTNHRAFDSQIEGSWLLVATGGPTYLITVRGTDVRSVPADRGASAEAVIEGSPRDILAHLLGRPPAEPLRTSGDRGVAALFHQAFPGP
jgi:uncharacterized protein (TIGR03083 family)